MSNTEQRAEPAECEHRYLTVIPNQSGWVCAHCGEGILSLSVLIPLSTIERCLTALTRATTS